MSEGVPNPIETKRLRRERIIALARELSEGPESTPFPGLDQAAYEKLKADIAVDADRSGYDITSPTLDELVAKLKNEGMKVVVGSNPLVENVFILPMGSNDIQNESVLPKHLQITEEMDARLKELILLSRG